MDLLQLVLEVGNLPTVLLVLDQVPLLPVVVHLLDHVVVVVVFLLKTSLHLLVLLPSYILDYCSGSLMGMRLSYPFLMFKSVTPVR